MITLLEAKKYINISKTENDSAIQGFINSAVSELESECNRLFVMSDHTEYTRQSNFWNKIFVRNPPINSVAEVYYYDTTNGYINLFTGSDTIDTCTEFYYNQILLRKSYSIGNNDVRVKYNGGYKFINGTGKINILAGTNSVEGILGADFVADGILSGDYLSFAGERMKVLSVTDTTHLTLVSTVTVDYSSEAFNISNVPEDLRLAIKQRTAIHYEESGLGHNLIYKSSEGMSSGASSSASFKELNQDRLINKYKIQNI